MDYSERWQQAGRHLWQLWQDGKVIEALPNETRPATRTDGYQIQSALAAHSAKPNVGWKIAATSAAGQQHIGVDGPLAGRLIVERCHDDGAEVAFGNNRMAVGEPEFAFRLGREILPRDRPYTVAEVLDVVSDLHPAIELPDSRFADFATVGAANLIADNACAHEFVLGAATTADWRNIDLARFEMKAEVVGRLERDGVGSNVLGDPRMALAWLVNEVTGLGLTMAAGEVITTGTCAVPLPVEAGDHLRMDFGELGRVEMRFAAA